MSSNIINLTHDNFNAIISKEQKPILIDFWAEWCSPCKIFLPILEEIAQEYQENIIVAKINVDDCTDIIAKFEIQSIPTLLLLKKQKVLSKNIGVMSKVDIQKLLKLHLDLI